MKTLRQFLNEGLDDTASAIKKVKDVLDATPRSAEEIAKMADIKMHLAISALKILTIKKYASSAESDYSRKIPVKYWKAL